MKNLLIIVIFLSLLDSIKALDSITLSQANIESKIEQNEDFLMLQAADYLANGDYESAIKIYENLYKKTKEPHFLKQIAIANAQNNNLESALNYAQKYQDLSKDKNDVETSLIIVESLVRQGEFERASKILERVNKAGATLQTRYILANLYLQLNEPNLAMQHLVSIYDDENTFGAPIRAEVLAQIITIYFMQNNVDKAFFYINDYLAHEENLDIDKFVPWYLKYNRLDDLKTTLQTRFENHKNMENLRILVATLLEIKQDDKAISLLTENENLLGNEASELLMYVYANKAEYKKAYDIAKRLYNNTKDIEYLGLSAVYGFEIMPNKSKDNLTNTIDTLEYVLKEKEKNLKEENKNLGEKEAFYYNFLGYLLIDYDIDAKAGLDYVSKALALSPNSIEYLDSLAWGFYKIKDCQKAKETIELIPEQEIKSTQEILRHYELINSCRA